MVLVACTAGEEEYGKSGDYPLFNMFLRPGRKGLALLFSLRLVLAAALGEDVPLMEQVTDAASNTLILIACGVLQWTVLHMDRTEARNVAFAIAATELGHVLAQWVFINPDALPLLEAYLRRHRRDCRRVVWRYDQQPLLLNEAQPGFWFHEKADGSSDAGRPYLMPKGVRDLKEAAEKAGHSDWVLVVEQRHGDVVVVEPGWMHQVRMGADGAVCSLCSSLVCVAQSAPLLPWQVTNLKPNLKMAWDMVRPERLLDYAEVQLLVQRFGLYRHFGPDYTGLQRALREIVNAKVRRRTFHAVQRIQGGSRCCVRSS